MHDDIAYAELLELAELIRTRQTTSLEVTRSLLDRIEQFQPVLSAYSTVTSESALATAAQADAEIARGRYRGPLHGVPIALKDLTFTADSSTGAGSTIHRDFRSESDATVVTRLRASGAVLLGKLRMTEGAFTSHHPELPTPTNPWDSSTWVGSSSSGSGVATAAGLAFATLGTDTGGSIRLPSAQNGVTGLKPTWGRVSRYGNFDLAQSMDHIGPMCRSAADTAAVLSVIAGRDENDPTSSCVPVMQYEQNLRLERPPVVGIDSALNAGFDEETQTMLAGSIEVLRSLGWTVLEVETPGFAEVAQDWQSLCSVEAAQAHQATYPSRKDDYGPELANLIELGRSLNAIEYETLLQRRRAFTGNMVRLFHDIDLLLVPGVGAASPTVDEIAALGEDAALLARVLTPTAPLDICGFPAITMPAGMSGRGTPMGIQMAGASFSEQLLCAAGAAFQAATDFHRQRPPIQAFEGETPSET